MKHKKLEKAILVYLRLKEQLDTLDNEFKNIHSIFTIPEDFSCISLLEKSGLKFKPDKYTVTVKLLKDSNSIYNTQYPVTIKNSYTKIMASSNLQMLKQTGNNINSDECYTPKEAILPLLPYLDKSKIYYECTSGKSSKIVTTLMENNFIAMSSGNRDFLTSTLPDFDVVITNPPYSKKDKFIEKCYELNKPFALLLPVSTLQGQKRGKLFHKYGIDILVLNNRIDFTGKGAPHFGVAWFCWNILPERLIFI